MKIVFVIVWVAISLMSNVYAQSAKVECNSNIDLLRQDLLSMLNKMAAIPPIAQTYTAAKRRYEDLQNMRDSGDFAKCVSESRRVLQITRPYGNR